MSIIGTGYVGLVTGASLAQAGNDVMCMDKDEKKIEMLRRGQLPIYEPYLDDLIESNVKEGRLHFTSNLKEAVDHGLIIFIAVSTPEDVDGSCDLRYVKEVAEGIGRCMDRYRIVVVKSTVPPGTCEMVKGIIEKELAKRGVGVELDVASNPEFLKEGSAVEDAMKPERIIIGAENGRVEEILRELYAPFVRTGAPIIVMDLKSSELTKYAANAMLATRISFMNELSLLCEKIGADIMMVMRGIGSDSRIGPKFLFAGLGFGGSCFPKDLRALIRTARDVGCEASIVEKVMEVNERQRILFLQKIKSFYGDLKGKKIAVWGLSFKPNTDDMREAPSIFIVKSLQKEGVSLHLFDPKAQLRAREIFKGLEGIHYGRNQYEILEGADGLLLLTEWLQFREPDFERMRNLMRMPVIFDGRNQYNPRLLKAFGFVYISVGRP